MAESGGRALVRGVDLQSVHVAVAVAMFHTGHRHVRVSPVLRGGPLPSRGRESKDGHGHQTRTVHIL